MSEYFNGQSDLDFTLNVGVDITSALSTVIKYIKPSGGTGSFTAAIQDNSGIIYYSCVNGDIDEYGLWTFWAYITFSDGRSAPGKPFKITFKEEGT